MIYPSRILSYLIRQKERLHQRRAPGAGRRRPVQYLKNLQVQPSRKLLYEARVLVLPYRDLVILSHSPAGMYI
jgi:hypothetical protein